MKPSALLLGITGLLVGGAIGHYATLAFSEIPKRQTTGQPLPVESPTRAFAKGLIVRAALFEGVTIEEAVDYLRGQARTGMEIDGMPKPYRLNFVVVDPNHKAMQFDLNLRDIQLDQLCERIAQVSGMTVSFDSDAIVFTPLSN
jgi:hypothetical protein